MRCQLLRTKVKIESNDRDPISAAFHLLAKIEESLSELSLLFSETIDPVINGIVGQAPLLGNIIISSCKDCQKITCLDVLAVRSSERAKEREPDRAIILNYSL